MRLHPKDPKALIEAAIGKRPCDIVILNAQLVNVFTGEIYLANIGIYDGFIAHIQSDPDELERKEETLIGKVYYDANHQFVLPGLIDAHIHIESTMMTPRNFSKAVVPFGTTTVVTDPHEIANVCGIEGVQYMHESSEHVPMRQLLLAPSCVPAVPQKEHAGAVFLAKEIEELLKMRRVVGLGEVMDYLGVIENDPRMVEILDLVGKKDLFIQGHAPFLHGRNLSAYLCAGPSSDHESRNPQEARDKMRMGMYVDARDSSISKNVSDLVKNVKDFRYLTHMTFCTDDREPEEILEKGHMNDVLRCAIESGMDPVDAIRSATLNVAREIDIQNLGAIAPGYVADIMITDSLEKLIPTAVFFKGELVAKNGSLVKDLPDESFDLEKENTVFIEDLKLEDFKIQPPIQNGKIKVRVIEYETLFSSTTHFSIEELEVKNGQIDLSDTNLKFVIVINRHKGYSTKGYGIVRNFGTNKGAVGSTVSHDSHNLTIVYDTPKDGYMVAKDLLNLGGGLSCAVDEQIVEHLPLPIAGLMSKEPCERLAIQAGKMKNALKSLGLMATKNPLLRIATLALPVIPHAKMSDLGIIDVDGQKIVSLFV